jgi:iron complex outermembrane recepter protein
LSTQIRKHSVNYPFAIRILAALCALHYAPSALAEEAESQAIIVIGQKNAPINIEPRGLAVSLGEEQFDGVNAFNVEDLMKYAPNFFVRKRFTGDSNGVPGFRGTHSTQSARTLVMVDGFVVSNFLGNSFGFAPKWGVVGPGEVKQFDIVYGPYSSRYNGHSMGGIVNIATRDPKGTEAFVNSQGFAQPFKQYGTNRTYLGYSGEAGVGFKQKDGPFSIRVSTRLLENRGQPMSWYGLTPAVGPGTLVTGDIVGLQQNIAGSPGTATNPIFAAQSPADITQSQTKLKLGYDDGAVRAQALLIYWWNLDRQYAPETYLRDAAGRSIYEGRVFSQGRTFNAAGANFSRTSRKEFLAGFKVEVPFGPLTAKLNLSTYQIASQRGLTSNGYAAGVSKGTGTLADQGPTGWYTGDLALEHKGSRNELALGTSANLYKTDQARFTVSNWREAVNPLFQSQTYGKTRLIGFWIEDHFKVSDVISFTAGLRYDQWRAFDGGIGRTSTNGSQVFNRYRSRRENAVSPAVSVQFKLGPSTAAQLSLAKATRFPTVGELFQGSLNGDGSFNLNSFDPNLKPEHSRDLNLIVTHDLGRVKMTGSFFWQRVKDTLFSVTGFNQNGVITTSFKNIDQTRQYGFELIGEAKNWLTKGLNIDANAAFTNSKTVENRALRASEGVQFPRIPKWRFNANLRYEVSQAVHASLGARYASRPNTNLEGSQRGDTFGYTSELFALDARVSWLLPRGLRVSAGVDNITNNRAWVFHPYPQRTFLIEAGWTLQ